MNLILNSSLEFIIPVFIGILGIILFFTIIIILKQKDKKINKGIRESISTSDIKLVSSFCSKAEMAFLEIIHRALPKDFIAFPYVSIEKLIEPIGDKRNFNKISSHVVDVCVFLRRDMRPVLIIDLYVPSPINQALKRLDQDILDIFKAIELPLVQIKLRESYNIEVLRKDLINSMPNKIFAMIKDKTQ